MATSHALLKAFKYFWHKLLENHIFPHLVLLSKFYNLNAKVYFIVFLPVLSLNSVVEIILSFILLVLFGDLIHLKIWWGSHLCFWIKYLYQQRLATDSSEGKNQKGWDNTAIGKKVGIKIHFKANHITCCSPASLLIQPALLEIPVQT